jgi:dihydroxyacetone kinase phosphotransfer subunit
MVSLLIVSHSEKLAEGVRELAQEMAQGITIASAGGTSDGRLGSDYDRIYSVLSDIYTPDGVIVLFDLGSSYMTAELAKEALSKEGKDNIQIIGAALVEGAVAAAVQISIGSNIEEILESLQEVKLSKM